MLPVRKKRILNEAAGIGTFLLKGLFNRERSLKYDSERPLYWAAGREGAALATVRLNLALLPARQPGRHPRPPPEVPR